MQKQQHRSHRSRTILDESAKLPNKQGNGILRIVVKTDEKGEIKSTSQKSTFMQPFELIGVRRSNPILVFSF